MSLITAAKQQFDALTSSAGGAERSFREEAWRRMEATGLPGRRTETWKYTSLAPLDKLSWFPAPAALSLPAGLEAWLKKQEERFYIAVVMDGILNPALSQIPPEIKISAAQLGGFQGEDGFSSMGLAVSRPGLKIEMAAGMKIKKPLLLVKFQSYAGWLSSFHQIVLGEGSELRVAEIFNGGPAKYLRTDFTGVRLGQNASLQWLRHQGEPADCYHFNETQVRLSRDSQLHVTHIHRGSKWLRGQLFIELEGENAGAQVQGLTFGEGQQHIDQRVVLNHRIGNTSSSQLFKGVFNDTAKGILNGKIFIAKHAQKVSSHQLNHNLLLSAGAEADTKPELEIYADDVKANHGATVGRLDEQKLFYLRSRGLTRQQAERLLSQAFVQDVYMKIPDALLREIAEAGHGA